MFNWLEKLFEHKSKCIGNTKRWVKFYEDENIPVRTASGLTWNRRKKKYTKHRWSERWTGKEWVLNRDTMYGNANYPIVEFKTNGRPDYIANKGYKYPAWCEHAKYFSTSCLLIICVFLSLSSISCGTIASSYQYNPESPHADKRGMVLVEELKLNKAGKIEKGDFKVDSREMSFWEKYGSPLLAGASSRAQTQIPLQK